MTVEFAGSANISDSIISGSPIPINATMPIGSFRDMLNSESNGDDVLSIALSRSPEAQAPSVELRVESLFIAITPIPVSEVAHWPSPRFAHVSQATAVMPTTGTGILQRSPVVAVPACVVFMSWLIIWAANPTFVRSMIPLMAIPVAPMTCGVKPMFNCVISTSQGTTVSTEQA